MFIGHYGVSFAAKRWSPRLSLGWLFLAVQLLDVLFMIFLLVGVEHMRLVPGFTPYNPYDLYDMPITHSVLGAAVWALVAAAMAAAMRLPPVVLGLAVFSHLLLDLPMHTRDMSLAGGATTRLGLGLWNHRGAALAAELVTLGAGVVLYVRSRRPLRPRMWIFSPCSWCSHWRRRSFRRRPRPRRSRCRGCSGTSRSRRGPRGPTGRW